jgi:hypothetical protein
MTGRESSNRTEWLAGVDSNHGSRLQTVPFEVLCADRRVLHEDIGRRIGKRRRRKYRR